MKIEYKGHIIDRWWTLCGVKKYYFSCYENQDRYFAGENYATFEDLKKAKDAINEKTN